MTLSTHVLDTARGVPAAGIEVALFALGPDGRTLLAEAVTNEDGRTDAPLHIALQAGTYEVIFATAAYFEERGVSAFYGDIPIRFTLTGETGRYHVPLLLAPWGYSTYRGS